MPTKKTKPSPLARPLSQKEKSEVRRRLRDTPELETASELLNVAGSVPRLKLLYLLAQEEKLPVGELVERVGGSIQTVSQHLAKLRLYRLVTARRQGQSLHYRLTDHPFNETLRASVF